MVVNCAQLCVAFTSSRAQPCVAEESSRAQPYTHGYNHVSGAAVQGMDAAVMYCRCTAAVSGKYIEEACTEAQGRLLPKRVPASQPRAL